MLSAGSWHDGLLFCGTLVASRQGLQAVWGSSKAVWAACLPASPAALSRCSGGALEGSGARAGAGVATRLASLPESLPEPRLLPAEDECGKEAALAALPPGYYSPDIDPTAAELGRACHLPYCPGVCLKIRLLTAEDEREKEAALAALPEGYFDPGFDPVAAELGALRPASARRAGGRGGGARGGAGGRLRAPVRARAARYDSFIAGVDEARRP